MVFDPDNYKEERPKIADGEYMMCIQEVTHDFTNASNTEYIRFEISLEEAYDRENVKYSGGNWSFRQTFWLTENATKFYGFFCNRLGVGRHSIEINELKEIWENLCFVAKIKGKFNQEGYPDYRIFNARKLNEEEKKRVSGFKTSGSKNDEELPF